MSVLSSVWLIQDAVRTLNSLQTPAVAREQWEKDNQSSPSKRNCSQRGSEKLVQMSKYLNICGIKVGKESAFLLGQCI